MRGRPERKDFESLGVRAIPTSKMNTLSYARKERTLTALERGKGKLKWRTAGEAREPDNGGGAPGEDRELVSRAKGDRQAFDALYSKYLKRVYTYIYYRVSDVEEAEDLTANVFLQALMHLDDYEYQGVSFGAWLLRIAHNLVANWYRERERRRTVDLEDWDELVSGEEAPGERLEREEELERVRWAVGCLPPDRQQVLILRFAEGMRHREIAEVVGKSPGAVKVLVHRSLGSVHRLLRGKEGGEGLEVEKEGR
jgi:RNA polymerase sigma-70 factor (ECF subfamily)